MQHANPISNLKPYFSQKYQVTSLFYVFDQVKPRETGGLDGDLIRNTVNQPQGSSVSPVLSIIFLSGVFNEIEGTFPGVQSPLFVYDIGRVTQYKRFVQQAAKVAIYWGHRHMIRFDTEKTEIDLFTRKRGSALRDRSRIMVGNHPVPTRLLGIWLDVGLTLKAHDHTRF